MSADPRRVQLAVMLGVGLDEATGPVERFIRPDGSVNQDELEKAYRLRMAESEVQELEF